MTNTQAMKKYPVIIQLIFTVLSLLASYLPLAAQFSGGAVALNETSVIHRAWHLTNLRGSNFILKVQGNSVIANDNNISDASTFILEPGFDDANWVTPDSRWFHIRSVSTGQYISVAPSGTPRSVSLTDYNEQSHAQQFRLIATGIASQYKLRSRLSASGTDLVLETNSSGVLQADNPKLDPSAEQKFTFNLAMPTGGNNRYIICSPGGRFMSDNGIKAEGTQVVQNKDTDESAIWELEHVEGAFYRIRNNLTRLFLTAPEGSSAGTIPVMTTATHGNRSEWELDATDTHFRLKSKEFPALFVSATDGPSGASVRLRTSADSFRRWLVSSVPGDLEAVPGNYGRIESGTIPADCFLAYGSEFKKALCERIGLSTADSELYFNFIREAIASKMGEARVDEILQKFDLNNVGHRIDLALMVRYYVTEVLPFSSYNEWSPAAQAVMNELQNKIQLIRTDYAARLSNSWDAYVQEQGSNLSLADLYFFWLDGDGFEWPLYYNASEQEAYSIADYASAAATFGERNSAIVSSTAIGATVVALSIFVAKDVPLTVLAIALGAPNVTASFSGIIGATSIGTYAVITAGPVVAIAVFAASFIAMQATEVAALQAFIDDINSEVLWAMQPINLQASLAGNNLLSRIKILTDLDLIFGAPAQGSFQYNTNDNAYLPPFALACVPNITLNMDDLGEATLTPGQVVNGFPSPLCGGAINYALSQTEFDCNDLPSTQVTLTAQNEKTSQSCTFTVYLSDITPPIITCPAPQTLQLGAACTAVLPNYRSMATNLKDNCDVGTVVQSPAPGTTVSGAGNMMVTLTVTDVSGNSTECSFTVTKVDNTPPTITCPATQTLVLGANCSAALPNYALLAATADNCGVQSITQSPAPATIVSQSGNITVTLTVTDMSNHSTQCSFTVSKVDNTPPSIQCFPQTITFNGETQISLNADDLVEASDNCGIVSIVLSPSFITCAQLGQTLPITVTVTDINGLSSVCTAWVTATGLPCGWIQNPDGVNCQSGNNIAYNTVSSIWTVTSANCYSGNSFTNDAAAFARRTLCGNGSITTQVTGISGAQGWAGVVMRESSAAGAKKAQLMTNMAAFNRQEFRNTTGAQAIPQQSASQGRYWLRIVREGNQFSMFVSNNGQSWAFAGAQNIVMNTCIEIGLSATNNTPNSTVTATFANMSMTGNGNNLAILAAEIIPATLTPADFSVFPNPTNGEVNVDMSAYTQQAVRLEVYDFQGKALQIMETESTTIRLDLSAFQKGVYLIRVVAEGLPAATKRVVLQGDKLRP